MLRDDEWAFLRHTGGATCHKKRRMLIFLSTFVADHQRIQACDVTVSRATIAVPSLRQTTFLAWTSSWAPPRTGLLSTKQFLIRRIDQNFFYTWLTQQKNSPAFFFLPDCLWHKMKRNTWSFFSPLCIHTFKFHTRQISGTKSHKEIPTCKFVVTLNALFVCSRNLASGIHEELECFDGLVVRSIFVANREIPWKW